MSSYIGVRCPVCNKKFSEADDIVVCPICGAPHHRDCYAEKNQCAFVADHLSGKEWRDPNAQIPPSSGQGEGATTRACARCGTANPPDSIFCQVCGNLMTLGQEQQGQPSGQPPGGQYGNGQQPGGQQNPQGQEWSFGFGMPIDAISMAYGGLKPDEEIDGESVRDIAQYIGTGSAYYLPRFQIMSESGRSIMPNLSAFLFNFLYFFYRKMYLVGAILLGLYVVSIVPSCLYTWEVMPQLMHEMGLGPAVQIDQAAADHFFWLSGITRSINFFIGVIFSLCANRFYYAKVLGAVHNIRTEAQDKDPAAGYALTLSKTGGASKVAVIVVIASICAAYFAFSLIVSYSLLFS